MNRIVFFICLLLSVISSVSAQNFSNKGKDFWLAYPGHIDGNTSRMALYISATVNTKGVVEFPGGSVPFDVVANQATTVQIFPNIYPVINPQAEGIGIKKGIHITSEDPVVVYSHVLNAARSGSTLVFPVNTLGREYTVASIASTNFTNPPNNVSNGSPSGSQFTIVGVEDNTTIEIIPTVADANNFRPAKVPYTINLNKGDVYQFRSGSGGDLSGTSIRSIATGTGGGCKPLAVFGGHSWATIGCPNVPGSSNCSASGGDNLFMQLIPKSSWGKKYLTAPFAGRAFDIVRIYVSDPASPVVVNGAPLPISQLLQGSYYELATANPNLIESDKPISVVQFMISQTCDPRNAINGCNINAGTPAPFPGDPEMVLINPIEQTINDVTVVSARRDLTPPQTNITNHYFTIIMKSNATGSLRIDGRAPTGNFIPIGTTGYSYLHEDMTAATNSNPSHRIKADSGFIALAYGLGNVESYGYNAGTNLIDLYRQLQTTNEFATVPFPAVCTESPFRLQVTFPFKPLSINWRFGSLPGFRDTTYVPGLPDSTYVIDNQIIYLYKFPGTYVVNKIGIYPVKITVVNPTQDGCTGEQEVTYDLSVSERPKATINVPPSGCVNIPVVLSEGPNNSGSPIIRRLWQMGDGTLYNNLITQHTYLTPGNKTIRYSFITDIGCVSDTVSQVIPIGEAPTANFLFNTAACEGQLFNIRDSSTTNQGALTQWNWTINGIAISRSDSSLPAQLFATAGNATISLAVTNSLGCVSAVTTKNLPIRAVPQPNFDIPSICLPSGSATFTNRTTISTGDPLTYLWNFGDPNAGGANPNTSTVVNPTHFYSTTGPFTVNLKATSSFGCSKDTSLSVSSVFAQPKADFQIAAEICQNDTLTLVATGSAPNSRPAQYRWLLNGNVIGTDSILRYPTNTLAPGNYTFVHFFVSGVGCFSDTISKSIVIHPKPTAAFTIPVPNCLGADLQFTNQSIANVGAIQQSNWLMGDGSTYTTVGLDNLVHRYATEGVFSVQLVVTNDKGCVSDPLTKPITISPFPVVNFGTPEVCLADAFAQFTDSSTISNGSAALFTYLWNFGDPNATAGNPNTSTLKNPTHKYTATGSYKVSLTVTSGAGCATTFTKDFIVNGSIPKAQLDVINANNLCSNTLVEVKNNSTVDFGNVTKVEIYWDFQNNPSNKTVDDDPVGGKIYGHLYNDFGSPATQTFQVKLIAYSGISCLNEFTTTITVNASPGLSFDSIPAVCQELAPFVLTQARENRGLAGTGSYSGPGVLGGSSFSPARAGAGLWPIRYSFIANNGCKIDSTRFVLVNPTPTANAGPDETVLEGQSIQLKGVGKGEQPLTYLWSPGTYLSSTTRDTTTSRPIEDIRYQFTVTTPAGCKASDEIQLLVLKKPVIPNVFSPNGDGINDLWIIPYLNRYPGNTVEVYNRYGQLVYQSVGYNQPWNGTFNGSPLPAGTYYYIINPKSGRPTLSGSVLIIR